MSKSWTRRSSTRSRQPKSPSPKQQQSRPQKRSLNPSSLPTKLPRLKPHQKPKPQSKSSKRPGKRLLSFDRRLGVRFVAGADEAGRGSLAGPLVVAGVLLDYELLQGHRVRPLALLNDSKQVEPELREVLLRAVLGAATQVSVRVIPACDIDRNGLHRSNLAGLRAVLTDLAPRAERCLVDGFRLGPTAPPHSAVVDGDTKSAAIAAASIIAKVTRDRIMRRLD